MPAHSRPDEAAAHISKARRPTQKRARATVDAIIEAAGQLLVSKGRAAVTTNAVAERAGVSIGSLYQYFPNKEAIFQALQERHRDEVMPLIRHSLDNLAGDPRLDVVESIVTLLRGLVELHEGNPMRMRALARELHEQHTVAPLFVDAVAQILASRIRRTPVSQRAVAWLLCATVTHVGWTLVHEPPPVNLDEVLAGTRRMLRGLLAKR
jgi:AcrR family transcriptional regulator